jgi:hypothetical protein
MDESTHAATSETKGSPMSWLQLLAELHRTVQATMGGTLPGEFWEHVQASRKEGLLATRSLIDAQIARLEEKEAQAKERTATKITVQ